MVHVLYQTIAYTINLYTTMISYQTVITYMISIYETIT